MWAAVLFSLGLIALAISRRFRAARVEAEAWAARTERSEGTVQVPTEFFDLSTRQYKAYGPYDGRPHGKVIFKARDGREYGFRAAYGANEGDKVAVLYDPASPSTATLDTGPPSRWGEQMARMAGGLLFVAAFVAFWMNR